MTSKELTAAIKAARYTVESQCIIVEEAGLDDLAIQDLTTAIMMGHALAEREDNDGATEG